jgi:hypothetical protein
MPASAQVQAVIFVDENGNGSFQVNGGASNPLAAFFGPDPSGGLAGNVLYYQLPFPLLGLGDVLLTEQPVGQGLAQNSDVVRFFQTVVNQTTFNYLIFYSDNGDGGEDLADTGLPSELSSNLVTIPEVGPEGNNGVVYTPSAGNPGARDGAVEYDIISDSPVPEPSTVALTGVGLLAAALLARRRRRA